MERRAFFKVLGASAALAAGGSLYACSSGRGMSSLLGAGSDEPASTYRVVNNPEVNFSSSVDVLIVGSGVAGLSAAMAPLEQGRSVMIVDKLDLLGGESFSSFGVMRVSGSSVQKTAGITTTALEAWDARKQQLADEGVSDLDFAKRLFLLAPEWVDHLVNEYGSQFADPKTYVSTGAPDTILLPKNGVGDMESVMVPLRDGLLEKGAVFSTGMRALAFILGEGDAVCGMRLSAEKNGAISDIRARTVVMATGGFVSNQSLVHTHLPAQEHLGCYTYASSGEGQVLCGTVGGHLVDMDKAAPLIGDVSPVCAWGLFAPVVELDPYGRRFAREDEINAAPDACNSRGLGFWWTVFDKQLAASSQARSVAQTNSNYARRLVGPFNSLDELTSALSVEPATLKATFETYQKAVDAKKDAEFGRTLFLQKLEAPFYAYKQFPLRYKTRGGAKTDGDGRLLNAMGSPITNVYCCGSVGSSSVEGLVSNGAFGMLVGQALAKALAE